MFDEPSASQPNNPTPAPAPLPPVAPLVPTPPAAEAPPHEFVSDLSPESTVFGPSAVEVGKLQPKVSEPLPNVSLPPTPIMEGDLKEPTSRLLLAVGILLIVVLVGVAVYWFVLRQPTATNIDTGFPVAPATTPVAPAETTPTTQPADFVNLDIQGAPTTAVTETPTTTVFAPAAPVDDPNKDTDADGLTDTKEAALGTNPNNADTDADGLTDGAEVNIWGTSPLKADTDGDNFSDGQEVFNGYNPKGPGKLK